MPRTSKGLSRQKSQKALVELLLKYGADVTAKTNSGCNALYYAVIDGDIEIVQLIWNTYGANTTNIVDTSDCDDYTLLHHASEYGNTAVVKMLIEAGADVDKITTCFLDQFQDSGFTALHLAVKGGAPHGSENAARVSCEYTHTNLKMGGQLAVPCIER